MLTSKRALLGATLLAAAALAGTAFAADLTIDQVNQRFSESSLSVAVGTVVTYTNHDDVTHNINVIDDDDNAADQGLQKPGEAIKVTFDKQGRFAVRCSIHPKMKMTVTVK